MRMIGMGVMRIEVWLCFLVVCIVLVLPWSCATVVSSWEMELLNGLMLEAPQSIPKALPQTRGGSRRRTEGSQSIQSKGSPTKGDKKGDKKGSKKANAQAIMGRQTWVWSSDTSRSVYNQRICGLTWAMGLPLVNVTTTILSSLTCSI